MLQPVSELCMAEEYYTVWMDHLLFTYQLMDIWVVSTFWLL